MTPLRYQLGLALAFSFLLHALAFLPDHTGSQDRKAVRPLLEARLSPRLPHRGPQLLEQPPLTLPPVAKPQASRPPPAARPARPPSTAPGAPPAALRDWLAEAGRQLKELDRQGKFYPEEAISRGLEGEVLVFLILDEAGNPAAARIEESCGHPILDTAALQAVRSLRSLPGSAPRKTLIPVRFRLM